jgi:hypothetical protein
MTGVGASSSAHAAACALCSARPYGWHACAATRHLDAGQARVDEQPETTKPVLAAARESVGATPDVHLDARRRP